MDCVVHIPINIHCTIKYGSNGQYIRRPLVVRGHQAERQAILMQRSMVFSHSLLSYFKHSSNIPSATTIWWSTSQQAGVSWSTRQQAGDIRPVTRHPGSTIYHPAPQSSQPGVSRVGPWESMEFQSISNTSENHENMCQTSDVFEIFLDVLTVGAFWGRLFSDFYGFRTIVGFRFGGILGEKSWKNETLKIIQKKCRKRSRGEICNGAVVPLKQYIQTPQQQTEVDRTRHECLKARWRI